MRIKSNLAFGIITLFALTAAILVVRESSQIPEIPKVKLAKREKVSQLSETFHPLASGKQVYEIITDKPRDPQILEVTLDPLDVEFGKTQTVTVKVKTKADSVKAEDFVLGEAICDKTKVEFSLKLRKAEGKEELITTWQGGWEREEDCTFNENYQISILAKNANGDHKIILSLVSASCSNVPLSGDYTVATSCAFSYSVNGVEKNSDGTCGNLYVGDGVNDITLTINSGQTIVWNPGCSIIIRDNGSIAINKGGDGNPGGQLKKTYIWAKDIDGDNYLDQDNPFVAQDSNPGGSSKRRYQLTSWPSSFDCNDSIAETTCYLDEDNDGYYSENGTTCFSTFCPSNYSTTTGDDCCDTYSEVHPGVGWKTSEIPSDKCTHMTLRWDWNCSGSIERQYSGSTVSSCTIDGDCSNGNCSCKPTSYFEVFSTTCGASLKQCRGACYCIEDFFPGCIIEKTQGCH